VKDIEKRRGRKIKKEGMLAILNFRGFSTFLVQIIGGRMINDKKTKNGGIYFSPKLHPTP
jgi:hypothetical protein